MGRVCANASLHWGPWLQRGLAVTGKQAEAQARVCVRTRSTLITSNQGGLLFLLVPEGVVLSTLPPCPRVIFMSGTLYSSCRGWHCVSGDLTGTFLPSASCYVYVVWFRCVYSAFHAFTTRLFQGDCAFASKYGGM